MPVGVFRRVNRPTHDQLLVGQIEDAKTRQGEGDLREAAAVGRDVGGRSRGEFALMICPVCGFENLQGEDICDNCGADLRTADIPLPGSRFERALLNHSLGSLAPPAAQERDTRAVRGRGGGRHARRG